jgi:hypothetical protein
MSDAAVRKTLRRAAPAAALAALAACSAFGVHRASDDLSAAPPPDAAMRLFAAGDTEGFLAPCGCEMAQYGGFARRAAYVRAVRRPGDLCVDLGNLLAADGPSPNLTTDAALEALRTLGCDAFVPAEAEIRRGAEFEAAAARRPDLRVVCANLYLAGTDTRVFAPWILHETRDGRTVAVVGVAAPFDGVAPCWRIGPLDEAVRSALAELRGRADAVIVAGGLEDDTAAALAANFRDLTLVVGGNSVRGSRHAQPTRGAPVMFVGDFGWHVGRVEFDEKFRLTDSWLAWLDNGVPDDADVAGIVARWQASVSEENAGFAEKLVDELRGQKFAGSESCASCHAAEYATWKASRHSHAMTTLAAKSADRDPSCVACHLHDVPRDPAAAPVATSLGVGCESCHGGAARHVLLARRASSDAARALAPATRDACLRCHVPPNVTHFDFAEEWPKIAHGRAGPR